MPAVRVRFGFVAMSRLLEDASPSHAVTVASVAGLSRDDRLHRLRRAALANLRSTLRILRHAVASGVEVYRFSSRLVPLATHPTYGDWPWEEELAEPFAAIGALVREHGVRVSFHPDHFTPLSSARAEVIEAARRDHLYHRRMLAAMGLPSLPLVIHLGGAVGGKAAALRRFCGHVRQLPGWERGFALENDDRTYDPDDVLDAAERLGLPVVLDFLHARVLPGRTPLDDAVAAAARTWRRAGLSLRPKYHLSSALSPRRPRDHAPYIAPEDALAALASLSHVGEDVDVVLEAKEKDAALFRLMADLAGLPGIVPASPASLDVGPAPPGAGARELLE